MPFGPNSHSKPTPPKLYYFFGPCASKPTRLPFPWAQMLQLNVYQTKLHSRIPFVVPLSLDTQEPMRVDLAPKPA